MNSLKDPGTMHMSEILQPLNAHFWSMMYAGLPKKERPESCWSYYLRRVEQEREIG